MSKYDATIGVGSDPSEREDWRFPSSVTSETELLPKWSSPDRIAMTRSEALSSGIPSVCLSEKEYPAWHSRFSNLIFFSIVLGVGAILGVVTTVRYMANPEMVWLRSEGTKAPDRPELRSRSSDDEDHSLRPYPVNLSGLSDVYHDMSDAELLRRASADGRRKARGEGVAPKVAFLFLTRGPLPLEKLWERYFEGHEDLYSVYIHAHPNFLPYFRPDSVFYRRNVPSKAVFWAKISEVAAERRLLANALLDAANECFVLVSESCIPITPFPVAYQYYLDSEHSFVHSFIDRGSTGLGRYYRVRDFHKLYPEISPREWRKGSQFFEMSRELSLVVVADRKYYAKFEDVVCAGDCVCYMDEHYLPTVLTMLAPSKLANRSSTYFEFRTNKDAHPYKWEASDVTEWNLKNVTTGHNCSYNGNWTETCHMFARKFSPGTIEPLLELATASFGIP